MGGCGGKSVRELVHSNSKLLLSSTPASVHLLVTTLTATERLRDPWGEGVGSQSHVLIWKREMGLTRMDPKKLMSPAA